MSYFFKKNIFINQIVIWSWFLLIALSVYQLLFFWSVQNVIAVEYNVIAWIIITIIFLKSSRLEKYPLSIFLILGFVATQFYLPLLFTSIERKPVIYNLELPYQVFLHSFAALVVLTITHFFYRHLYSYPFIRSNSILYKLSFFDPPADTQVWLMGFIGLGATIYVYFLSPSIGLEVTGAASDKAIQGLIPFSYAPFFIPFKRMYGKNTGVHKSLLLLLVSYTILLFIISIGRNSRGAFMMGFTSVGFAYALGLLLNIFEPNFFTFKNGLLLIIFIFLIIGPVADIGTAMVIVRGQRNKVSNSELISLTLDAFSDKKAIKLRRLEDNMEQGDWDERYLDNIFTARFANLKFNDASLVQSLKTGSQNKNMFKFSIDYIIGTLPTPLLSLLKISSHKEDVYAVSIGDYLYYEAGGPKEALGGFRTGHFAGTGMAAFGWWYLLLLSIGILPVYYLFDKLVLIKYDNSKNKFEKTFSFCGLLSLNSVFQFLPTESVITTITFIIRGWLQMIFLYIIIYYITFLIKNFSPVKKYFTN